MWLSVVAKKYLFFLFIRDYDNDYGMVRRSREQVRQAVCRKSANKTNACFIYIYLFTMVACAAGAEFLWFPYHIHIGDHSGNGRRDNQTAVEKNKSERWRHFQFLLFCCYTDYLTPCQFNKQNKKRLPFNICAASAFRARLLHSSQLLLSHLVLSYYAGKSQKNAYLRLYSSLMCIIV